MEHCDESIGTPSPADPGLTSGPHDNGEGHGQSARHSTLLMPKKGVRRHRAHGRMRVCYELCGGGNFFKGEDKPKPNKNGRPWQGEREGMVREAGVEIRFL